MSKIYLKNRDIELLKFLSKYKVMSLDNSSKIYGTKTYQEKRMVVLVKYGYINRLKNRYISLGHRGVNYLSENGIDIKEHCRSRGNIERLKLISDVASMTIGRAVTFIPSWEIKDKEELTKRARRYIGVLEFEGWKLLVYSTIGKKLKKQHKAIYTDMKKETKYKNFIVLSDDCSIINKDTPFIFENEKSVYVVPYTDANKNMLIDYYDIRDIEFIQYNIMNGEEMYGSDWKYADFVSRPSRRYVIDLLLLDIRKIEEYKRHLQENYDPSKRDVTIVCIGDNKAYLEKEFPKVKVLAVDKEVEEYLKEKKEMECWETWYD